MLLGYLLELLRNDIQALDFVERYGGLVQKVTYKNRDKNGQYVDESYPVSCMVNQQDCNTSGQFYTDLIPNDKLRGVFYFEVLQGMTDQGPIIAQGKVYKSMRIFTGRARLVGWVNTKRLGVSEECYFSGQLVRKFMQILNTKHIKVNDSGFLNGARVEFNVLQELPKTSAIFDKYTYNLDKQFLLDPFDYFAIDVEIRATMQTGCQFDVSLANSACWVGTPDSGVGGVPADYLGDATGTFAGVQKLGSLDCEVQIGNPNVSFVVKSRDRSNTEIVLGTFTGQLGDTLNTPVHWDTSYAIYNYISPTTVGDEQLFVFNKLAFAQDNNFLNVNSVDVFVEIRQGTTVSTPVGIESTLYIFKEDILGTYNSPVQIAINRGTGDFYLAEFASNTGISQGFVDRFYTTRKTTDQQGLNNVTRIKLDTTEDSEGIIYFYRNQLLHRLESTGRDVNGFIDFDTAQVIDNLPQTSLFIPFGLLNETVNGRPVIMALVPAGAGNAAQILEWNGSSYDRTFLPNSGVFAGLGTPITGDIFAYGNDVYIYYRGSSTGILRKLSYTGDYKNPANWTGVNMCTSIATPASAGTGNVASTLGGNSLYVDGAKLDAFGNPRVLLTLRPSQVIQVWETLKANPTIPADFIASLPVGQLNVNGNIDDVGNDALLTNPIGIDKYGSDYWICGDVGDNTVKTIADNDYLVTTRKGVFGVAGRSEHIEF